MSRGTEDKSLENNYRMKSEGEEPERVLRKGWMGDVRVEGYPGGRCDTHHRDSWRKVTCPFPLSWTSPGGSVVENPPANAGDVCLIPWVRMIPQEE